MLLLLALFACSSPFSSSEAEASVSKEDFFLEPGPFQIDLIEGEISYMGPAHKAHERQIVAYELSLFNTYDLDFHLKRIEVFSHQNPDSSIASFDSTYLALHFDRSGLADAGSPLLLSGNHRGIVNLILSLDTKLALPLDIYHRVYFQATRPNGSLSGEIPMEMGITQIPKLTKLSLGLPFQKGRWLFGAESHQDSRNLSEGHPSYPQRYAIDWILLDSTNAFATEDLKQNKNWLGYGIELLAVSDGIVVGIKDSIIENVPWEEAAVRMSRETISGNYVRLDIGNGVVAHYAHLIPGSLKVKVGDRVRQGQPLGLLGNSGSSDCPHLHFHLESAHKLALGGEGLPYHFASFKQLVSYSLEEYNNSFDGFRMIAAPDTKAVERFNELPIGNGIIEFH